MKLFLLALVLTVLYFEWSSGATAFYLALGFSIGTFGAMCWLLGLRTAVVLRERRRRRRPRIVVPESDEVAREKEERARAWGDWRWES
jgi:hypothetical protein